jgi:hypothetical protein
VKLIFSTNSVWKAAQLYEKVITQLGKLDEDKSLENEFGKLSKSNLQQ